MAGMAAENQGWFAYSVLLVLALFIASLPLAHQGLMRFLANSKDQTLAPPLPPQKANSFISRFQPINTRYFTVVQIATVLILPLLLLAKLIAPDSASSLHGAVSTIVLCITGGCALVYANRKGDLRWIDSMDRSESRDQEGSLE